MKAKESKNQKKDRINQSFQGLRNAKNNSIHTLAQLGRKHPFLKVPMYIFFFVFLFVFNLFLYLLMAIKMEERKARVAAASMVAVLTLCIISTSVFAVNYQSAGANMGGTMQSVSSAQQLVDMLCASGASTKNAKITAVSSDQYGIGTGLYVDKTGQKTGVCEKESFNEGVIITTGKINNVLGTGSSSNGGSASGDSMITSLLTSSYSKAYDWTCLEFDLLTGGDGYVGFEYVYLTAEMNYHGTSFVDPFALYVNGVQADMYSNQSAVNVNDQYNQRNNSNDTYYFNNGSCLKGTKYNGISTVLKVGRTVTPNSWAHIKIVLADAGDHILDTTVIIRAHSLTSDKNYSADKVNVTFENNGHGTKPADILNVTPNGNVTLPSMSDLDYEFDGWYSDAAFTTPFTGNNITSNVTAYAKWVSKKYTVSVNLKKDSSSWAGQTLALYSKGVKEYDLTASGDLYSCDSVTVNGVSKDFDIYVNGKDSGTDVTVYREAVTATIDYTTYKVTTTLDGTAKDIGNITIKQNVAVANNIPSAGVYEVVALPGTYDVNVSGVATGYQISVNNKQVSIPYYKATVKLNYEEAEWKSASVTLRQDGKIMSSLPFASKDGNVYEYSSAIMGNTGSDIYDVYVNGMDTGKKLQLNAAGLASQKTVASVDYYRAEVTVKLDGGAYSGKSAFLYANGVSVYQLKEDTNNSGTYVCDYVQKNVADEYKLMFASTEAGTIKSSSKTAVLNYYTVTFMKNSSDVFKTQSVLSGTKAKSISGPYVSGKTFLEWCSDSELLNTFDFNAAITSSTTVYPKYVQPIVRINSYSTCSATLSDSNLSFTNKNTSGTGAYYMPAFTITGFPEGDAKVIKFIEIKVSGAKVYVENVSGVTVDYNNSGNGEGKVKISFGEGYTAAEAENYVRSHIVFKPTSTANGTIKVSVNGTTTD